MASCTIQEKGTEQEKETVKENGSYSLQPEPLDGEWSKWLTGKWKAVSGHSDFLGDEAEGVGESNEEGESGFTIEPCLNGQFLIWKSWPETGEMTDEQKKQLKEALKETTNASEEDLERFVSMPYKSLYIQTIDPTTGERIGYFFDSQRCIATGTGRLEKNREIMEWVWSGQGQGATSVRIIEKINDNKFTLNHKYNLPDGSKMEDKIEMTRKVDDPKRKEAHKMSIRFDMIGIFVNDLQKTIDFYRDVIGLEVKQTDESYAEFNHDGIRFAAFERVMLPEWLGVTPTYPDGLNGTFELAIDLPYYKDVDRKFDQFVKAGARAIREPRDMPWGQRSSMVADPDGNLIELGSFNSGEKDGG
ncbi:VOC family protein [Planctomycetota bacterium]